MASRDIVVTVSEGDWLTLNDAAQRLSSRGDRHTPDTELWL
ncbi:hypothetical protein ABZ412_08770 [Nocardia sp. NPDC005746]